MTIVNGSGGSQIRKKMPYATIVPIDTLDYTFTTN